MLPKISIIYESSSFYGIALALNAEGWPMWYLCNASILNYFMIKKIKMVIMTMIKTLKRISWAWSASRQREALKVELIEKYRSFVSLAMNLKSGKVGSEPERWEGLQHFWLVFPHYASNCLIKVGMPQMYSVKYIRTSPH